ncbi:BspA family leucine-rich repeat surface protein [Mangrovimonas xylaniphaga]|uniref:BspA family leucine-rich repeat surface protein n=1 Tax=Mangrovimonas xylaniphaga TaxID=1645915 RepID=UPI0006B60BDB|nr:BspA family leucine-rich repeat surface protein [Mangrovimonas xylaniphaga]
MKQICLFITFVLLTSAAVAQAPFVTTWGVAGHGNQLLIRFETEYGEGGNYTIDFGDGTILTNQSGVASHTYEAPGTYTVTVSGNFDRFLLEEDYETLLKSVEQWGDTEWTSMEGMFKGCSNLVIKATDVPNLSKVTSMKEMFYGCASIGIIPNLGEWDVSNVTNLAGMFNRATSFNQSLDTWDVSKVSTMGEMFSYARSFNQPLEAWDVSNVVNMEAMFFQAASFNQPLNAWDVSKVTNMSNMFSDGLFSTTSKTVKFNQPLDAWDVSNVTDMSYMFCGAKFNQSIEAWDVSNLLTMKAMFYESKFNHPIASWDVSNVTDMSNMFYRADFNQPIGVWDVSNVTDMSGMFSEATNFSQPLNSWNVSSVTNMAGMFKKASSFNYPINTWDVSNVTEMGSMFREATNFNQSLNAWDVSNVTNMSSMFYYAINFNQPLDTWNLTNAAMSVNTFVMYSGLNVINYDLLLERFLELDMPTGLTFNAHGLYYCNQEARDYLINTLDWNMVGDYLSLTCNSISGSVFYDLDANGCTTEDLAADVFFVNLDNGISNFRQSVANGMYSIPTRDENYIVSLVNVPEYFTVSPEAIEVDFTSTIDEIVNFCVTSSQVVNDISIALLPITEGRPGFEATYKLVVKNLGTQSVDNITATLTFDEAMQSFVVASAKTETTTSNSLEFSITALNPFESWETSITMQTFTPPIVNGGDVLSFTAMVLPNSDDYTPNDNTFNLEQIVVNSRDPNDKQVLQGESIVMEQTGEYLDYLIRFQNTGSASAVNIRVEDELHENLDWSTLSITNASHEYQVEVTNGNEVDFIFNGIYLTAESQNEQESHGFIAYKIKPKTTVEVGDIMSGNASIYFDYNAPIITNTVTTEVVGVLGVEEHVLSSLVTVYPNPIDGEIHLEMNDEVELISIKLYNMQGRLLLETKENTNNIKTDQLSSGVYMLSLETNKGQLVKRVVKK